MERKEHELQVDREQLALGENTFACTYCGILFTLVWNGEQFTMLDGSMPDFSSISIVWIGYA